MKLSSAAALAVCLLCVVGALYLAGLRYCVRVHGLHHYGVNRANNALAPPPPALLQRVYNPALFALARYYSRRDNRFMCSPPLDVRVLDALLFGS